MPSPPAIRRILINRYWNATPGVVDRAARDAIAELLRHFAAGRITNDQWDTAVRHIKTKDPILDKLWGVMWFCYDDLREHRLTGKYALSREQRRFVARMIVFLYSDLPYEWPRRPAYRWYEVVLTLATLGLVNLNPGPPRHPTARPRGKRLWPFFRRIDLEREQSSAPRLLGGRGQNA